MPLLPGAGWSPAGTPALWASFVLFSFVEFQFAAVPVRLFSCGWCKSWEGPCRPGARRNLSLQQLPARGVASAQPAAAAFGSFHIPDGGHKEPISVGWFFVCFPYLNG